MPARRLVVALAVLLIGVFGIGIVAAINRSGEPAKPSAQPSPTPTETFSPSPTVEPLPTETPTPEPTETPTPAVSGSGGGGGGGGGGGPKMPNTGAPAFLGAVAVVAAGAAAGARRLAH